MGWPSKDHRDYDPPLPSRSRDDDAEHVPDAGAPQQMRLEVAALAAAAVGLPLWFVLSDHGLWMKVTGLVFFGAGLLFEVWWKRSGREPVLHAPRPQLPGGRGDGEWGPSKNPDDYR